MRNLTIFRISLITTILLFLVALVTPIATIAVDIAGASGNVLEYVCVWCQYGSTSNNPYGTANILYLMSFDFYYTWVPILVILFLTLIPLFKAFPKLGVSEKIPSSLAVNILWLITIFALFVRGSLSLFIQWEVSKYQGYFPNNLVIGELSWASGALVIGAIMAASTAMFGYMEYIYDMENQSKSTTNSKKEN